MRHFTSINITEKANQMDKDASDKAESRKVIFYIV